MSRRKHLKYPQAGHPDAYRSPDQEQPQGMYLDNPDASPTILKNVPQPMEVRQAGFGFSPRPGNINDISPGDAAAGRSQFRRAQFFTQVAGVNGEGPFASAIVYDNPRGIATARSMDTRPRFWHVSFFNQAVLREAGQAVLPLTEQQIAQSTGREPTLAMTRGRIQVHDESGSRFFDLDILGTRSLQIYAFGVTVFILTPRYVDGNGDVIDIGYEVDQQNESSFRPLGPGTVEDSLCSARIIPSFQNATQIEDNITRTVTIAENSTGFIEIPPGARNVQIRTAFTPAADIAAGYIITFAVRSTFLPTPAQVSLGQISLVPGTNATEVVKVPNARFILFSSPPDSGAVTWVATFDVEA